MYIEAYVYPIYTRQFQNVDVAHLLGTDNEHPIHTRHSNMSRQLTYWLTTAIPKPYPPFQNVEEAHVLAEDDALDGAVTLTQLGQLLEQGLDFCAGYYILFDLLVVSKMLYLFMIGYCYSYLY